MSILICFKYGQFSGSKNPGQSPDWSPLWVQFKISDEHPHPFLPGILAGTKYYIKHPNLVRLISHLPIWNMVSLVILDRKQQNMPSLIGQGSYMS